MSKYRVGFIGTGGRSSCYAAAYRACADIEVAGLADPDAEHRAAIVERTGLPPTTPQFDDWRDLLAANPDLDGAVICSPNHLHAEHAVACLERGLPIALEKPLATTPADCERILDAEAANGGRVLLGFVLRSTPFYSKIHDLLAAGTIGRLVSIQADELPGLGVSSVMTRSPWRRHAATSGGSMLEKSCHDMDILNWMMGCRPTSLTSYGGTLIFTPRAEVPEVCDDCPEADTCQYCCAPAISAHEDQGEATLHQFIREDNRCIYNIDKDVADVQNVALEYESGAVANFMLNFHCMGPRASRNFHAVGTRGRIWGNFHDNEVCAYDNLADRTTTHDTSGDGSGHGGGDRLHALLLHRMMAEPAFVPDQSARAGYLSALMCFATDISRAERRRIDFTYNEDGRVTLR